MGKRIRSRVRQVRLDYAARLGRVVSIREVSRETGVSVSTIRRLEEDRAEGIDFSTLARLASFYGVAMIDELFEMTDDRPALHPVSAWKPNTRWRAVQQRGGVLTHASCG